MLLLLSDGRGDGVGECKNASDRAVRVRVPYVQETFTLRALGLKPLENKLRLRNSTPVLRRRIQFYAEVQD